MVTFMTTNQPIYDLREHLDTIFQGHVLKNLKLLPDDSVDMVITSPPYYAKMLYETVPQEWGCDPNCDHEWEEDRRYIRFGIGKKHTLRHTQGDKHQETEKIAKFELCTKCNGFRGELGQEPHYEMFVQNLYDVFMEVHRVLKPKGQFYLNMGDTFYGSGSWGKIEVKEYGKFDTIEDNSPRARFSTILTGKDYKHKCMMMIPERLVMRLVDKGGWWLRNKIIWEIPNKKPESMKDRFTQKYEHIFLLTKSRKYYADLDAVKIPSKTFLTDPRARKGKIIHYEGKSPATSEYRPPREHVNPGDVWKIPTANLLESHFATFPEALLERPILFASKKGDIVLDPFMGAGTTALVAKKLERHFVGIELNPEYCDIIHRRFNTGGNLQAVYGRNIKKLFKKRRNKE